MPDISETSRSENPKLGLVDAILKNDLVQLRLYLPKNISRQGGSTQFRINIAKAIKIGIEARAEISSRNNSLSDQNQRVSNDLGLNLILQLLAEEASQIGQKINLASINLSDQILERIQFPPVVFDYSNLLKVSLNDSTLRASSFKAALLYEAQLLRIDLQDSDMSGSDLTSASIQYANLENVILKAAKLVNTIFTNSILKHANLSSVNATASMFINTDLSHANLTLANLNKADFENANLRGANLDSVYLHLTNLNGANLYGAKYGDIELTTRNWEQYLKGAIGEPVFDANFEVKK